MTWRYAVLVWTGCVVCIVGCRARFQTEDFVAPDGSLAVTLHSLIETESHASQIWRFDLDTGRWRVLHTADGILAYTTYCAATEELICYEGDRACLVALGLDGSARRTVLSLDRGTGIGDLEIDPVRARGLLVVRPPVSSLAEDTEHMEYGYYGIELDLRSSEILRTIRLPETSIRRCLYCEGEAGILVTGVYESTSQEWRSVFWHVAEDGSKRQLSSWSSRFSARALWPVPGSQTWLVSKSVPVRGGPYALRNEVWLAGLEGPAALERAFDSPALLLGTDTRGYGAVLKLGQVVLWPLGASNGAKAVAPTEQKHLSDWDCKDGYLALLSLPWLHGDEGRPHAPEVICIDADTGAYGVWDAPQSGTLGLEFPEIAWLP